MCPANETYARATPEERLRESLERYYERRLEGIHRHEPLAEDKFIPVEELKELADAPTGRGGAARSG